MSRDDVLDLLDEPIESAAVGAALELGLFWLLASAPLGATQIAERLGIPYGRCQTWLRLVEGCGLIASTPEGFVPTGVAAESILDAYSRESWAMLAQEARERAALTTELPSRLTATAARRDGEMADYVAAMTADPTRARRFTRMLYELHQDLAGQIARALDLSGVLRLMDLGGGSGVVAERLAMRWPRLSITIVDVGCVCEAGRELAAAMTVADQIEFLPADFLADELPGGYDAVLECDVGIYSPALFARIRRSLAPGGRFFIVDELAEDPLGNSPRWALIRTLSDPGWTAPTTGWISELLAEAGFGGISQRRLEPGPVAGGRQAGPIVIEAIRDRSSRARPGSRSSD